MATRKKQTSEAAVREIRRKTRRRFAPEEKIRIVLDGLRGEQSVSELCRREGIASNLYYRWSKDFLEGGKKQLAVLLGYRSRPVEGGAAERNLRGIRVARGLVVARRFAGTAGIRVLVSMIPGLREPPSLSISHRREAPHSGCARGLSGKFFRIVAKFSDRDVARLVCGQLEPSHSPPAQTNLSRDQKIAPFLICS